MQPVEPALAKITIVHITITTRKYSRIIPLYYQDQVVVVTDKIHPTKYVSGWIQQVLFHQCHHPSCQDSTAIAYKPTKWHYDHTYLSRCCCQSQGFVLFQLTCNVVSITMLIMMWRETFKNKCSSWCIQTPSFRNCKCNSSNLIHISGTSLIYRNKDAL